MNTLNNGKTVINLFEKPENIDFCWNFSPEELQADNSDIYRKFLRNVFEYDHSKHEFDRSKFE